MHIFFRKVDEGVVLKLTSRTAPSPQKLPDGSVVRLNAQAGWISSEEATTELEHLGDALTKVAKTVGLPEELLLDTVWGIGSKGPLIVPLLHPVMVGVEVGGWMEGEKGPTHPTNGKVILIFICGPAGKQSVENEGPQRLLRIIRLWTNLDID